MLILTSEALPMSITFASGTSLQGIYPKEYLDAKIFSVTCNNLTENRGLKYGL